MSLMFLVAKEMLCCGPGATVGVVFTPEWRQEGGLFQQL